MTGNISLPPDQSFRKIHLDHTTILLSVSEEGIRIGEGTDQGNDINNSFKGYYIFAENVQLNKSFAITLDSTTSLATISTHSFKLSTSSDTEPEISVSGEPGANNDTGAQREDNINGKPSGSLCLYVENCTSDVAHLLKLTANGGKGGDTKEKKGNAGDGGMGGTVRWVGFSAFTDLSMFLLRFATNRVLNRELGQSERLTLSHPIILYLQRALAIAERIPVSSGPSVKSITDIVQPIQSIVKAVESASATVPQPLEAVWEVRQAITAQYKEDEIAIHAHISVSGGAGGSVEPQVDANERGSAGEQGSPGSRTVTLLRDISVDKLCAHDAVFVHPDQCQMLYDRAMTYWYFERNGTAIELLSRLYLRLSFIPSLQDGDPLAKAYAAQEKTLRMKDAITRLRSLRESVAHQLCVLESGNVDFYGYRANWVPRVSYGDYNNYIQDAMKVFKDLETSYVNYHAALDKQQSVNSVIRETKANIVRSIEDITMERDSLKEELKDLDKKIGLAGPVVERKHREFKDEYQKFKEEVDNAHKFSPDQIFNALATMATSQSWADVAKNGVVSAMQLGYDWGNKYPDDNGVMFNKKWLINKLTRSVATGLEDFNADFQTDGLSGEFLLDERLPQFLIEQERLDEILSEYSSAAFAKAGEQLKKLYKNFTDALAARNGDIVVYNSIIQTIANEDQEISKLRAMRAIADKDVIIDEDLEQMTGYVRGLFENARARVMRYLHLGQRALRFKVLRREDLLSHSGVDATDIPLSVTSDVLAIMRSNLQNLLLDAKEEDSGAPAQFPADWEHGKGKRRYLSGNELESFLANKTIDITFSPVIPGQDADPLWADFENCANVRVYRVWFILDGLKAKPGTSETAQMKSTIIHAGNETIVSRRGVLFSFEHTAVDTSHRYSVDEEGKITNISDNGRLVDFDPKDRVENFGAPGPFTTWRVQSTHATWNQLDTSSVQKAYLEFFGTNYAVPWDD